MKIKEVKMFACPLTGKLFKTAKAAQNSATKEQKARDEAKVTAEMNKVSEEDRIKNADYIRLNCSDIKDLSTMIVERAALANIEVKDLNLRLDFTPTLSCSHNAPLTKSTNWSHGDKTKPSSFPGFSGNISANVICHYKIRDTISDSASNILFGRYYGKFRGMHTSGGCPGNNKGEYKMDIGFGLFLEDFPLIEAKYAEFLKEKQKFIDNKNTQSDYESAVSSHAYSDKKCEELENQIEKLKDERMRELTRAREEYIKANPIQLKKLSPAAEDLFELFSNYSDGLRWK